VDVTKPAPGATRRRATLPPRVATAAGCVAAGACIALAVPPVGLWPLAIVGVAGWDRLLAGRPAGSRALRSWLIAVVWLAPMTVWMWDLTVPGWLVAVAVFGAWFAAAGAAVPPGAGRWLALPGALMLAEAARWSFPFDGVPLATLAMTQADGPLAVAARIGGALGVVGLVGISGVALSAAAVRAWRPAAVAVASVAGVIVVASVAPSGTAIGTLEVAAVQGGGPQRTRATAADASEVLARHLEATEALTDTVDVVVWPENVVSVSGTLDGSVPDGVLRTLASDLGVPVVAGITERAGDTEFLNASVVYLPDGTVGDRYDKVLRVPFGEYVPLRPLMERLAPDAGLPRRDARAGTTPAVVALPEATLGVAISWEVFFSSRARDGATNGGEVLINPTNGSSYWLTQVQSQQVASSQLRALETGRWVVQAAPTGFSAIVDPGGTVVARTDVGEQAVIVASVERRTGATWATRLGAAPILAAAAAAVAGGWALDRRGRTVTPPRAPSPDRH